MDFTNQRNTASDVRSRLSRHQREHHEYAVAITKGGQLHCWAHTKSNLIFIISAWDPASKRAPAFISFILLYCLVYI